MPFITQGERTKLAQQEGGRSPGLYSEIQSRSPGQLCYIHYKWMKEMWNRSPRWTTADAIYREVMYDRLLNGSDQRAKELAWQVFFNMVVMPYEIQKRAENGDI